MFDFLFRIISGFVLGFWQQVEENLKLHYLQKPERLKINDVCCNYCAVES
jgi:hypothetical protein